MEPVNIRYQIRSSDISEEFSYQLNPETQELVGDNPSQPPEWARLDHNKCSHCPLNSEEQTYCPLALQLHGLVDRLHNTTSIDEVELELIRDNRRVIQTTDLQNAIGAILEMVYPSCGCPKTKLMRPLARFHVPANSEEERVYRIAGMYQLAQYFREKADGSGDFEFNGLIEYYSDMSILNKAVASRLKAATRSDSVKNAIALMDMYSTLVPLMLEDELVELRSLFTDLLPEQSADEKPAIKSNFLERIKSAKLELVPLQDEAPDDEPNWLKEARARKAGTEQEIQPAKEPESEPKSKAGPEPEQVADQILKKSNLSLELVPTEDISEKPKTGKAIFDLPDD